MLKRFSKHTPDMRGRVRVTVEFDAVYVREMGLNIKDLLKWATTSPEPKEMVVGLFKTLSELE